ncbi:MAG TPA: 16S rRNA (guanine(966)-N(2))-methyltransferase RsmD [Blastocatellia bacterium]|jgi:16S rRNA (guanine(966)-N(2))-methyltransferase RsmD|nr:16S rRNA (guanine(966)-N(2))-methyltransferase RsmD [Blastocatellia bacterium]
MRVIAGIYKGRRLKTLEGLSVRPTSDRLRETIFNILTPRIELARFADICAGSGAIGIEALSRGARHVTFVESSLKAARIISENLRNCGIREDYRVINRDAIRALKNLASENAKFDIIYFDPPYNSDLYTPVMWVIAKHDLLAEDGVVIVEHRRQTPLLPNYDQLRPYRQLTQGESLLTFFGVEAGAPGGAGGSMIEDRESRTED